MRPGQRAQRRPASRYAGWLGSVRRRRTLAWVLLLAALWAGPLELGGCAPSPASGSGTPGRAPTAAAAWTALDGDTLRAPDGTRVRLPGVDTPERGRPYAQVATAFSKAFVSRPGIEPLAADAPRDRYGRSLADVRRGTESLSTGLVEAGLAWVYEARDASLVALQAQAVAARRGVHAGLDDWSGPALVVSRERFHRRDCPSVRNQPARRPLEADLAGLLAGGRAPCRNCLPWPPRGRQPIGM